MNALTSSRNSNASRLMDRTPRGEPSGGGGIRDLLRDTALLVTSLADGGTVHDAVQFRDRCAQAIERFSTALTRRGYPPDVREEALVAQCGLLDETALRHLPPETRAEWAQKPLQVERFNLHDAGERVIDCLEEHLRRTSPDTDLLECYSAILGLGFRGRYDSPWKTSSGTHENEVKRRKLITAIDARLEKLRPATQGPFVADRAGHRFAGWLRSLSPWVIAGLVGVVALIVWFAWSMALDAQLAHIVPAKAIRP